MAIIRKLASLKLTVFGMILLAIGAIMIYGNPDDVSMWVLVLPMVILAINLSAAITTNSRINQQPGLLLFHVCLLAIVILAAIGRLTHMDAHLELVVGTEFSKDKLIEIRQGPLHSGDLQDVKFIQGPYTVEYAEGLRRGLTFSNVKFFNAKGQWEDKVIGDDRPLVIRGYRFYTTYNKGFSPVLTWIPRNGEAVTGTINMPSYPLFEYKQDNRWLPPGSDEEIKFWLQLQTGMNEEKAWTLDGRNSSGILVVSTSGGRYELKTGESVQLDNGTLRYDALTMWMGYRLFYDPTIQWMFFVAIAGVLGLSQYFWKKLNLQPWMEETEAQEQSPQMHVSSKNQKQSTMTTRNYRSQV